MRTLRIEPRSIPILLAAAAVTLIAFLWPFFTRSDSMLASSDVAPLLFALALPMIAGVVSADLGAGPGLDSKAVAMLGVLAALGAALRPLGTGIAGVELVFFLIILGGYVFGPSFGFLLGSATLAVSALLTAGVGPWLPFQMLAASWIGLGAGTLPRARGAGAVALIVAYGVVASLAFGFLMNLSFWPFTLGPATELSFVPGAAWRENMGRYLVFYATTSLAWDLGRAITTSVLIVLVGPIVIRSLRRTARRGSFGTSGTFQSST